MTLNVADFVLFKEVSNAAGQALHCLVLLLHHSLEIQFQAFELDATFVQVTVLGHVVEMRVVQHSLAWYAAYVETRAAQGVVLLNANCL